MSNLSNIGFNIESKEDFYFLVEQILTQAKQIKVDSGTYYFFSDPSGAEIWVQKNESKEVIGVNPHFKGKSRYSVNIKKSIERESSILDGAFYAFANLDRSDEFPFVFDAPDHKTKNILKFPQKFEIQLSAFPQELSIYESEKGFKDQQTTEFQLATEAFIPSGLFKPGGEQINPPEALGIFTGKIIEFTKKTNKYTDNEFYWMLVQTLGGEIDVVVNSKSLIVPPTIGGIIEGQFWLSGRIIENTSNLKSKSNFFTKFLKFINMN